MCLDLNCTNSPLKGWQNSHRVNLEIQVVPPNNIAEPFRDPDVDRKLLYPKHQRK